MATVSSKFLNGDTGDLVMRFVDLGEIALAQHVRELEDIILYLFTDGLIRLHLVLAFNHIY